MDTPSDRKYSPTHEWVRVEGDEGVIGITDFAQRELGDIVYVEMPKVGQDVKAGDACAVVESVKAASDIYAPVSGTVTKINEVLAKDTAVINRDAYGEGWFFTVSLKDPAELSALLAAGDYEKSIVKPEA